MQAASASKSPYVEGFRRRSVLWRAIGLWAGLGAGISSGCGDDGSSTPPGDTEPMKPPMMPAATDPDCPTGVVCEDHPAAYALRDPKTGSYGNYDLANRPLDGQEIRYIVIHTTDASWDLTIQIFQDPNNAA